MTHDEDRSTGCTAIVLAAGMGTRMKTEMPKVLHKLGSETLLGRVVANLKSAGIEDIIAVVGYKAEIVEKLFHDQVRFVRQPELLGSGDAVGHAVDFLKDQEGQVLVTCGDTPLIEPETYRRLLKKHLTGKAKCTLLTAEIEDPAEYGRIMRDEEGVITGIVEQKDASARERTVKEINVGTYCFCRKDLKEHVRDIKLNSKKKEYYLTDIVKIFAEKEKKILSITCSEDETIGINGRQDLAKAYGVLVKKKNESLMTGGVTIIAPQGTYIDPAAKIGRDTVILPGCIIDGDVEIGRACRIGPHAHIRPGCRIADNVIIGNFAEVCRTSVGSGSIIKHQCYLGDAEIGRRVNIGAGTITANYDGQRKNRTVIADDASIGVGTCMVAPVKVGRSARTGAGSVVTGGYDIPDGVTVAGVPARPIEEKQGVKNG